MKIFGREPAVYVAVIETLLALLVTFRLDGLTTEQATNILAVTIAVGGLITAWTVKATLLAALSGVGRAVLVLMVSYGMNLTQEQIGLAVGLIAAAGAIFLRPSTSPISTPLSRA